MTPHTSPPARPSSPSPPQRLWLIRHGQREDFANPGWLDTALRPHDPPLAADGVIQAQETGAWLAANARVRHLFASPFLRAAQTAHHLAHALALPIRIEPGLSELLLERWFPDGASMLSAAQLRAQFARVDHTYRPAIEPRWPEGDDAVAIRARQALALADSCEGDIAFASHGGLIAHIARAITPGTPVHTCPCCLICFERSPGGWRLIADGYNMDHLSYDPGAVRLH